MTTTKAATKRAERERRRANGEVRCELWLTQKDHEWARVMADAGGCSVADIIRGCVRSIEAG